MTATTKAKRGDLVAMVCESRSYVIGHDSQVRTTVDVCEVTSITREGAVKAVRRLDSDISTPVERYFGVTTRLVIPASVIDKPAAIATVLAHTWEGHTTLKPFDSVDEARAALRPHLRGKEVAA